MEKYNNNLSAELRSLSIHDKGVLLICLFFFAEFFLPFARAIENRIGLSFMTEFSDILFWSIALITSCTIFAKKIKTIDLVVILGIAVFYHFSPNIYPATKLFVEEGEEIFIYECLIYYFVGLTFDSDKYKHSFSLICKIAIVLSFVYLQMFDLGSTSEEYDGENMHMAYFLLPVVLYLSWYAWTYRRLIDYLIAIFGMFFVMSLGARGAVVCGALFFVLYIFIFHKFKKKDTLKKVILLALFALLYTFSYELVLGLMALSVSIGLSPRIYEKFLQNEMLDYVSSGRVDVQDEVMDAIVSDRTGIGYGFFSDRLISHQNIYVHNLELELLCDFGVVIGGIIIIVMGYIIFLSLKKYWQKNRSVVLLIFLCSSVFQLQLSNSYLICPILYFYLGFCVTSIRKNNKKILYDEC